MQWIFLITNSKTGIPEKQVVNLYFIKESQEKEEEDKIIFTRQTSLPPLSVSHIIVEVKTTLFTWGIDVITLIDNAISNKIKKENKLIKTVVNWHEYTLFTLFISFLFGMISFLVGNEILILMQPPLEASSLGSVEDKINIILNTLNSSFKYTGKNALIIESYKHRFIYLMLAVLSTSVLILYMFSKLTNILKTFFLRGTHLLITTQDIEKHKNSTAIPNIFRKILFDLSINLLGGILVGWLIFKFISK